MPKQRLWERGVLVEEIELPAPNTPQPLFMDKTSFLAWFDEKFGANATPTRQQLSDNWPTT